MNSTALQRPRPIDSPACSTQAVPHVLVVKDHPDTSDLIADALGPSYRISVATDVAGLPRIIAEPPDVIILDWSLPVLSGQGVLDALRSHGIVQDVPVVVVAAMNDPSVSSSLLREGVVDCLPKPFSAEHLQARVEGLIAQRGRTRSRLQHTEERYRTLFDCIDEGFCIVEVIFSDSDSDSGTAVDYRFLEVNPSFERQTGLHGARGKRMRELAPAHEAHWFDIYGRIALTGEPARFEQPAKELGRWYDVYAFRHGDPRNHEVAILFNDITHRKHAELQMRQTKAMLRAAMRLGQLGAWALDLPERSLHWSSETRSIFAVGDDVPASVEFFVGLIDSGFRAAVSDALDACIHRGVPFDLEALAHRTDGAPISVRLIGEPSRGGTGLIERVEGAVQDVTEMKAAVARANDLDERFTSTLERMADALFTLDRQWRFTYVNGQAERALRRSRGDLLGRMVWEEFPQAVGSIFQEQYERALAEMSTVEFETYYAPLAAWLKVSAHPSSEGLAVHFQDVTAQRNIRDALTDTEGQYRMLFESSLDGILQLRADGTISKANAAACGMFGMSEDTLVERHHSVLVAPDDSRLAALLGCEGADRSTSAELTLVRGDGSRFDGELSCSTYRASNGALVTYVIIRDASERSRYRRRILEMNAELAERVRERTAELEQANAELKSFAHSLAHDLRSPIAAIAGFTDMLKKSLPSLLPERSAHYLGRIREAATRMDAYIDGLLSLARVSKTPMTLSVVDISAVARDIVTQLQAHEPTRRSKVRIQERLEVLADAPLLRMALENLLGNAWKFSARREVVEIELYAVHDQKRGPCYCVEDHGAGFDMAYADKLFESFQRLHSQSEFPGTGIGLANVDRIIRRHGGQVWAESEQGVGARFFFTLAKPNPRT
jgi:PAS domain S-box-containing protein